MAKKGFKVPGVTFSAKRASGLTSARHKVARATGIPTTKAGRKRKAQRTLWELLFGKK